LHKSYEELRALEQALPIESAHVSTTLRRPFPPLPQVSLLPSLSLGWLVGSSKSSKSGVGNNRAGSGGETAQDLDERKRQLSEWLEAMVDGDMRPQSVRCVYGFLDLEGHSNVAEAEAKAKKRAEAAKAKQEKAKKEAEERQKLEQELKKGEDVDTEGGGGGAAGEIPSAGEGQFAWPTGKGGGGPGGKKGKAAAALWRRQLATSCAAWFVDALLQHGVNRQRLVHCYKTHDPSKLPRVDYFLAKYAGKEEKLFTQLDQIYGVTRGGDEADDGARGGEDSGGAAEREALMNLFASTRGARWRRRKGWEAAVEEVAAISSRSTRGAGSAVNLSGLEGVLCDTHVYVGHTYQIVTDVMLPVNGLVGRIPPALGGLRYLRELNLAGNRLSSNIPSALGQCKALVTLDLSRNQLIGAVPTALCTGCAVLQTLRLQRNRLAGSLPQEIRCLRRLRSLELQHNSLSGEVPAGIGDLDQLRVLQMGSNRFVGSIPPALGTLSNLQELWLEHNSLSGPIPPDLFPTESSNGPEADEFGGVDAAGGGGSGSSEEAGGGGARNGLWQLRWLVLSNNALTGGIPEGLGRCSHLQQIYLQQNKLTGTLPLGIGDGRAGKGGECAGTRTEQGLGYPQLKVMYLQGNALDMEELAGQAARLRPVLGDENDELTVVW
jgi:hypothetical protein